ncbi:MAG: BlaI/MecI/CopY family transcriptional regulator [Deltaproteobacteria bacterium]|jgi:predicted transcriptional regulator|nr:BlaI/MecI/CopY family transcriptional regulator [Deltaproteobacteria bacterium]
MIYSRETQVAKTKVKAKSLVKASESESKLLTEGELELMTILWRIGEGSVADVIAGLPAGRDLAYTSVSTILRILEQKMVVTTRKEGRGHIYVPSLEKSTYEARTVRHIVDRVFDGTPVALVKQLLDSGQLKSKDIEELKLLINRQKETK